MRRRAFLAGMSASLLASRAHAFGATTRLAVAELDLGPGTLSRPAAWKRLLYELGDTTSVEVGSEVVRHGLEDEGGVVGRERKVVPRPSTRTGS